MPDLIPIDIGRLQGQRYRAAVFPLLLTYQFDANASL